jgi:hypothetical protein
MKRFVDVDVQGTGSGNRCTIQKIKKPQETGVSSIGCSDFRNGSVTVMYMYKYVFYT